MNYAELAWTEFSQNIEVSRQGRIENLPLQFIFIDGDRLDLSSHRVDESAFDIVIGIVRDDGFLTGGYVER
jgi:hypothetical protein